MDTRYGPLSGPMPHSPTLGQLHNLRPSPSPTFFFRFNLNNVDAPAGRMRLYAIENCALVPQAPTPPAAPVSATALYSHERLLLAAPALDRGGCLRIIPILHPARSQLSIAFGHYRPLRLGPPNSTGFVGPSESGSACSAHPSVGLKGQQRGCSIGLCSKRGERPWLYILFLLRHAAVSPPHLKLLPRNSPKQLHLLSPSQHLLLRSLEPLRQPPPTGPGASSFRPETSALTR